MQPAETTPIHEGKQAGGDFSKPTKASKRAETTSKGPDQHMVELASNKQYYFSFNSTQCGRRSMLSSDKFQNPDSFLVFHSTRQPNPANGDHSRATKPKESWRRPLSSNQFASIVSRRRLFRTHKSKQASGGYLKATKSIHGRISKEAILYRLIPTVQPTETTPHLIFHLIQPTTASGGRFPQQQ